ncbi:uncharacterized protein METZ01_LOCUS412340 [marine metagenome]|uniref:Uncharacterized protein n=1 Tax=marine metagenome TaxID=408172 RepID=A0A382WKN0_9ZZZZ
MFHFYKLLPNNVEQPAMSLAMLDSAHSVE